MLRPFVSVVIPCFNHGEFLPEAIASVEQCERASYELIIVNDGSTDEQTCKTIGDLQAAGYRVIQQTNQGLAAARNAGIQAANGAYVLPLDADNRIRPNYISKAVEILEANPQVSVVYGRPHYFGDAPVNPIPEVAAFNLARLLQDNFIDACAVIRKTAWNECGGYDSGMPALGLEDWDLWLSLAERSHQFFFLDDVVFDYRVRRDSMINGLGNGHRAQVIEYLEHKHPLLKLHRQTVAQGRRLSELEEFVARLQGNALFKIYHWAKHFGRRGEAAKHN